MVDCGDIMAEHTEWVKSLTKGDVVAVESSYIGTLDYAKQIVKRITPTGKIRLANDDLFDKNGSNTSQYTFSRIVPYDTKVKEHRWRNIVANRLSKTDFKKLDSEKLKRIYDIVKEV